MKQASKDRQKPTATVSPASTTNTLELAVDQGEVRGAAVVKHESAFKGW
jgi:hypothetical protein